MAGFGKLEGHILTGVCPDEECGATLFFPQYDSSIECTGCGQRLSKSRIRNIQMVTDYGVALHNMLKNIILGKFQPKKGPDCVKVLGVSNYQCKLLSPLLTKYGMDKVTGKAKLLSEMQDGKDSFDCSVLAGFSFVIEPEHIDVNGYGRDRTGSTIYLKDMLNMVKKFNNNEECLIPIHADGDGHCLVHAISRALIGRELFWHALRENLRDHLISHLDQYKALFSEFVQDSEWQHIIDECDPKYQPLDGDTIGLRNIHIFGLANVLRRPIILLDSLGGIRSSADYSGIFLPGLYSPDDCKKSGMLNKPLCLAWSSAGRNHYIALVGVKDHCLPHLPEFMVPKVYGMPQSELTKYIDVRNDGSVVIGGDKCLNDKYIRRLIAAMEELFFDINKVSTSCVADVHQYIFKTSGSVGIDPQLVLEHTQRAIESKQLFRCLTCEALSEHVADRDWFRPGGELYTLAIDTHKVLDPTKFYSFPLHGYICKYDAEKNELIPDLDQSQPRQCQFCQGTMMRHVRGDGTPVYINGDRTKTRSNSTKCRCGYKHYWDGKEYDNIPERLPLSLDWAGKSVQVTVEWFQYESDASLNSNVYSVAEKLVESHFPGEFGSERLVQKIVDTILRLTAKKTTADDVDMGQGQSEVKDEAAADGLWSAEVASKIILTGQSKTLCKEELTKSATERELKKRVEAKAPLMQKRHSSAPGGAGSRRAPSKEQPQKQAKTASQSVASAGLTNQIEDQQKVGGAKSADMPKKVRISTAGKHPVTLNLNPTVTYKELQDLIYQQFAIPCEQQKIKYGFPPKLLHPPPEGSTNQPLDIQHGDKLTVDCVSNEKPASKLNDADAAWLTEDAPKSSWSGFDIDAHDQSAQNLLQGLDQLQNDSQDSLDAAISSLLIMASLSGKDFWTHVQSMPHLFSVGGLFYRQAHRDVRLVDGTHCTLPTLPNKRFRYNAKEDRLELCLEPYGHFPVEPGIEKIVSNDKQPDQKGTITGTSGATDSSSSSGSGAIIVNKHSATVQAFSGQGHSLLSGSEDIRMPQDLDVVPRRHHGRPMHLVNHVTSKAIVEEQGEVSMEQMPAEGSADLTKCSEFRRVGPGMTVLDTVSSNEINERAEMFQTLASQIEHIAEDAKKEGSSDIQQPPSADALSVLKPLPVKSEETKSEPMDST